MGDKKETKQNYNLFIMCLGTILIIIFMFLYFKDRQQQRLLQQEKIQVQGQVLEDWGPARANQNNPQGGIF